MASDTVSGKRSFRIISLRNSPQSDPILKIETASVSDAQEILALQKLAYRSEAEIYNDYRIPPMVQTIEEMWDDFSRQKFLRAVAGGRIVGSVRAYSKGDTCYIGRLIVHPQFQGQGIGTALMKEIENQFGRSRRYELFTGSKSAGNIRLYLRLGYRVFRKERMNDNLTMVFMERTSAAVRKQAGDRRKSASAIAATRLRDRVRTGHAAAARQRRQGRDASRINLWQGQASLGPPGPA
ncbi:MAG TPA: GNAT family N-acetyltransferase [Nitrososphaerales archaeon]|nr:GNAT family N-acetyltransferase [Nitrososphaerales archaeon]